jgi:Leucine rich repeat
LNSILRVVLFQSKELIKMTEHVILQQGDNATGRGIDDYQIIAVEEEVAVVDATVLEVLEDTTTIDTAVSYNPELIVIQGIVSDSTAHNEHSEKKIFRMVMFITLLVTIAASVERICAVTDGCPKKTAPIVNPNLTIACNFFWTNISACQTKTYFYRGMGGIIPTEIGLLTQATEMKIVNSTLPCTIPSELGNLRNLQKLYLYSNQFTGTIPSTIGNLSQLSILHIFENTLNGTIPSILVSLRQLKSLYLHSNRFTGTISSALGMIGLDEFDLSENLLTGFIPSELGSLNLVTRFLLQENLISGTIPSTLGNLSQLTTLYLDSNQLTGTIPSELGYLSQLLYLSLNNTKFIGTIPSTFSNLGQLKYFYLVNSTLRGTIPYQLCTTPETKIYIDCGKIACTCCLNKYGYTC